VSRIIYKYPIKDRGVIVPGIQTCIAVGLDPKLGEVCVWIEHPTPQSDLERHRTRVQYLIMGTGFIMEDDDSYHVGSVITPEGYVWHVYAKRLP
jgi:hypothetical protein